MMAQRNSATFRVLVEGTPQSLDPILRDEIYRIAREALRNAFHYAQARRIEVEITYGEPLLRLRIRDDGNGIDPAVLGQGSRAGHWGLPGMHERAKRIGAQLNVWSRPGAGTEVELTIPGSIAYETISRSRRLSSVPQEEGGAHMSSRSETNSDSRSRRPSPPPRRHCSARFQSIRHGVGRRSL